MLTYVHRTRVNYFQVSLGRVCSFKRTPTSRKIDSHLRYGLGMTNTRTEPKQTQEMTDREYEVYLFPKRIRDIITGISLFVITMLLLFFVVVFTQWG